MTLCIVYGLYDPPWRRRSVKRCTPPSRSGMRERRGRAPASALRVRCFEPAASRGLGPRDLSIYLCALRDLSFRRSETSHSSGSASTFESRVIVVASPPTSVMHLQAFWQ